MSQLVRGGNLPPLYDVQIEEIRDARDWPDMWHEQRYRALMHLLEMEEELGDLAADELPEMTVMALQDREPEEAADLVLKVVFGDKLRPGVRQNMVHQLKGERLYEEFAVVEQHAAIFEAAVLLHQVFPRVFPQPTIARLRMVVTAANKVAEAAIKRAPGAALVARLLVAGMGEASVLRRLYGEQLAGKSFPEASSILWRMTAEAWQEREGSVSRRLEIYSSWQWLRPLKSAARQYQASAHEDGP